MLIKVFLIRLKKLACTRSDLKAGILIEPSILERNKYQYKKINSEIKQFDTELDYTKNEQGKAIYGITKDQSINLSGEDSINTDVAKSCYTNINKDYFPDSLSPDEFQIYSRGGVVRREGRKFLAESFVEEFTYGSTNVFRSDIFPSETEVASVTSKVESLDWKIP